MNISIRKLLLINTIIIILSMILIYHLTPEGYEGGISGKKYGNITFLTLVVLNLLYSFYYVIRINHTPKKMLFLFLNLGAIFVVYFVCAVFHSI
jgi:hypothetical protein